LAVVSKDGIYEIGSKFLPRKISAEAVGACVCDLDNRIFRFFYKMHRVSNA